MVAPARGEGTTSAASRGTEKTSSPFDTSWSLAKIPRPPPSTCEYTPEGENRPPLAVNQRAKARSKAVGNEDEDEDQDGSDPETEGGGPPRGEDADAVGNIIGEDAHTNVNIANARNAQDARERRAMATDDDQHEDDRDGVGVPTPSMRTTKSQLSTLGSKPTLSLCVFRLSVRRLSPSPAYPTKPAMSTNTTMATTANATPPPTSVLRRPRRLSSLASDNALAPDAAAAAAAPTLVSTRSITSP